MARRNPEKKAADLFHAGKAVFTQRSVDEPTVQEAFSQLPEWLTQRGGIFAWDDIPPDIEHWKSRWRML
jgi:hypothetical protein